MKEFFRDIARDKITRFSFLLSFTIILVAFSLTFFYYSHLPPFIPIFNHLPWGDDRIGPTITIFVPLVMILSFSVINMLISSLFYKKIPLLSRIFSATSLILSILIFLFVIKIIMLTL